MVELTAHARRIQRIIVQRQKVASLAPGSEERTIEAMVLAAMLNSAAIGNMADTLIEAGRTPRNQRATDFEPVEFAT